MSKVKVSLENDLQKEKQKLTDEVQALKDVKLLLQGDEQEDQRILSQLSNNSKNAMVERELGTKLELEKMDGKYDGNVYTKDQIKKLAVNYRLRFLQAKHYTGTFDVQVAAKIKEFAKTTNSPMDAHSLPNEYFVLAPPEQFELKSVKHIFKKELDPAIFYRIDPNHYRLIHKWGNDFSILRFLNGFRWANFHKHWLFNAAMVMPAVALFVAMLMNVEFYHHNAWVYWVAVTAGSFLVSHVIWGWRKIDDFEIIQSYFTNENFDSVNKTV